MMVLALACPVIPVSASSVRLASPESGEFSSEEAGSLQGSRSTSVSPGLESASSSEDPDTQGTHRGHGRKLHCAFGLRILSVF